VKLIIAAVVGAALVLAAGFLGVPRIIHLLSNPGAMFAGDTVLEYAARNLADANRTLRGSPDDPAAHLARAKAYLAFGYLEGARLELQNRPEDADAEWNDLGRSLDELELKTDEIRRLLHEAETSASPAEHYPPIYALLDDIAGRFEGVPKYRAIFLKGYLLLREGRKAEAEPIFRDQLTHYVPLKAYVSYNHARSLMVSGSEDQALKELNDFIGRNPANRLTPLAHLERINLLRDLGRSEEAIAECQRAIDRYPDSTFAPKVLRKWAEIYESAMDFDQGATIRVRLLRDFPDSAEGSDTLDMFFGGVYSPAVLSEIDQLVVAYAAANSHPSGAFAILSVLADSTTLSVEQRARACQGAGLCEYRLGLYYESIDWCTKAVDLAPGTEWADRAGIRTGYAFKSLNKIDLAKQAFWKVVQGRGPQGSAAAEILWKLCYELEDMQSVDQVCRYIVDEYPRSKEAPAAMAVLAYLGCSRGQYQTGRGFAQNCVDNFPANPASAEAGFWLARATQGLGRNVESRDLYMRLAQRVPWSYWGIRAAEVIQYSPETIEALDPFSFSTENSSVYDGTLATAWELYDAGTLELAQSEFQLAVQNGVPGAKCGLALVEGEQGDIQSAVPILRDASETGDQANLTPARQRRLLDVLYPRPFEDKVTAAALAHDVPVSWLWGAMRQESCFNPRAQSGSGACGLIQIMPETGRFIAAQRGASTFDPATLWDPATNLDYGSWYFAYLRNQVGDNLLFVMAAYNGGPGRLTRWREELPTRDDDIFIDAIPREETRNFAHWVYCNVKIYEQVLKAQDFQLVPF
jgi:tetratricopeptide (TPR) repeat protein